jgi:hypothetical protein
MLIARLQGGMGNQCFIYAAAKARALQLGIELAFDTSSFLNDPLGRRYSLGLWKGINYPIVNSKSYPVVKEKGLPYNIDVLNRIQNNCIMDGYWQTEKYFSSIADVLRSELVPRQPLTPHGIFIENKILSVGDRSTFLTIRRSDYLNSNFHGVLTSDYYLKALEIVAKQVNPFVFIFSDDPQWCQTQFRIPYDSLVSGNFDQTSKSHLGREDEELTLMKKCKHAVLANSSYSWWGAWLNPDPGIRVAPKQWFLSTDEDARDIILEKWLRV